MSALLNAELRQVLHLVDTRDIILAIGNSYRRDDGVGPYIAASLSGVCPATVIDAGITPENHIEDIITVNPPRIVFIDAADFGGRPGDIRLLAVTESRAALSTHMIPLPALIQLLSAHTRAEISLVGIQIADAGFGEGLSEPVRQAAHSIIALYGKPTID